MIAIAGLKRIISGGQTGVDRAALDVALALGVPCGGWVPRGRKAEDGPLPDRYPVREAAADDYATRTRLNVRDADATLVLTPGVATGGTALTVAFARQLRRPCLIVDPTSPHGAKTVRRWLAGHRVRVLNVAGPRESRSPGIYRHATVLLIRVLMPGDAPGDTPGDGPGDGAAAGSDDGRPS